MTWITLLWPMVTAACITIGLIHLRIGLRQKPGTPNLLFALTAFLFAAFSGVELALMRAHSPASYLELQRWSDLVAAAGSVTLVAFVWGFFGTGRRWLAILGSGLTLGSLLFNVGSEPRLVFLQIDRLRAVETLGGATYTVAEGTRNPWVALFYLGLLLLTVFVVDASVAAWRRGARRRAALVGGAITSFFLLAGAQASLVDAQVLATPYLASFFFLLILVAMAWELSHEVLQASQLAHDLQERETQLNLAATAAHLGLWSWDAERGEFWSTPRGRALLGIGPTERLTEARFFAAVHPDDCERVRQNVAESLRRDEDLEAEFRVRLQDRGIRWLVVRGRPERDRTGAARHVRGVAMDVTARKEAEEAAQSLSGRLIHAQEAERTRLARELHDDLNQSLALLAVELDLFGKELPDSGSVVSGRMQELSARVRELSSGVHRLAHELHPAKLEQLGLVTTVRGFCREFGAARKIAIDFEPHGVPRWLPDEVSLCIYRVVQEGLQNVWKHSGADSAQVELTANGDILSLVVSDQGCGFDARQVAGGSSLGLISMHERVRLVRGRLSVRSRRGEGTQIEVSVPLGASSG